MSILKDRDKYRGEVNEYYFALYINLLDWLVEEYRKDASQTAELCDETLDLSGRLLGRVRTLARSPQGNADE